MGGSGFQARALVVAGLFSLGSVVGEAPPAAAQEQPTVVVQLDRAPAWQLTDGATVVIQGRGVPPDASSVAQCGREVLVPDPAPPDRVAALCGVPAPVSVAADGTFQTDLIVHDPLTSTGGDSVPCGTAGCVVVLSTTDDAVVAHRGIAFGPPTIEVAPSQGIREGSRVRVILGGLPNGAQVFQCALPLGATLGDSRCVPGVPVVLDDWGQADVDAVLHGWMATTPDPVDCRAQQCGMAMFDSSGAPLGQPAPIAFAPPPSLTLEPSEGLLDGQEMTLRVENLPQDSSAYRLLRCAGGELNPCVLMWRDVYPPADGTFETTVSATQAFYDEFDIRSDSPAYCRANCTYVFFSYAGVGLTASYTMATGELVARPARRLHDGQRVQVTATQLMRNYPGVPVGPYPTGGWALTQCDSAILEQPDLLGVFRHCALGPPTQPVDVPGSTLDTTLDVKATIAKILGGSTDCTTTPDACVVGLVRLEQDGSLSTHLVPITFR